VSDVSIKKEVNVYVDYLARCEGETALKLNVDADGEVRHYEVNLFEPPRFFEGFLVGRKWYDAYETCSRICGICSVPHTISGIEATEKAFDINPSKQTVMLRKLANLSELNMNCIVRIFILGGPDFVGANSVFDIAANPANLELVKMALKLKRLGNDMTDFCTGRETHPVGMDVGRMLKLPDNHQIEPLLDRLKEAKQDAWKVAEFVAGLNVPPYKRRVPLIALHREDEYAINYGTIKSTSGFEVQPEKHDEYISHKHVKQSNALFYSIDDDQSFMVGPIARVVINFDQLSPDAKKMARKYWGGPEWFHENMPFSVYAAHAVEYLHTTDEMIWILERLKAGIDKSEIMKEKATPRKGQGFVCTEAPRGLLYYTFKFDEKGDVQFADIVTPTAHHVHNLEQDLKYLGPSLVGMTEEEATMQVELVARCYDLCCSCSVHCVTMKK